MGDVKSKFTLHPEYKDFVPGKTRLRFATFFPHMFSSFEWVGYISMAFVMAAIGLSFGHAMIQSINRDQAFANEGREVEIEVVRCRMKEVPKSSLRPEIEYIYIVEGVTYTDRDIVVGPQCKGHYPKGTRVPALYLASDPTQIRLTERSGIIVVLEELVLSGCMLLCVVITPLLMSLAFVFMIGMYLFFRWRFPRLKRDGELLEGEIVAISGYTPPKSTQFHVKVRYQFETPDHRILSGESEAHREDLKSKELPPVGTPIVVLYADDHAYMML